MFVDVTMLDGSSVKFDLDSKCNGQDLLDKVAEHLQLVRPSFLLWLSVYQTFVKIVLWNMFLTEKRKVQFKD
jgi:hypothetical protein